MGYLFDTDALSEVMRREPNATYLAWLRGIAREDQYASAVSVGELFQGAYRSPRRELLLQRIDQWVLPAITILPYDVEVARVFGEIQARLEAQGISPGDADVQIASTAIRHHLTLVSSPCRRGGSRSHETAFAAWGTRQRRTALCAVQGEERGSGRTRSWRIATTRTGTTEGRGRDAPLFRNTGNVRHHVRVPNLRLETVLADARKVIPARPPS